MNLAILGAGSWAIALSIVFHKKHHSIKMWEFDLHQAQLLEQNRQLPSKLPGIYLPADIRISNSLPDVIHDADYVIIAVPAQTVRQTMRLIKTVISEQQLQTIKAWIIVSKGIECDSMQLLSDILVVEAPVITYDKIVVVSGPSHAEEVSRDIPTTVVAASKNESLAKEIQSQFSSDTFRIYSNDDVIGVELCAGIKNVIAIATGISDGLGFGDNTKGTLVTRGMVEMMRLGKKMGAQEMTFTGLAGFGDLVTTCISKHSRNRRIGELIGWGLSLEQALKKMTMVAEGVETTKAVYQLSKHFDIVMPITTEVFNTLFTNKPPLDAVRDLMQRQLKPERTL